MPSVMPAIETALDAVLFDFDGVILESVDIKTDAFRALFAEETDHLDAIIALHRRHAGLNRLIKFEMIHRDILGRPLAPERKVHLAAKFQDLVLERVVACPMVPGASEFITRLAGRTPLAIVSGTPQAELQEIVQRRGMRQYFDSVCGGPRRKPEIVAGLLGERAWRPQRVLMLGDALEDLAAARAHNLLFVGRLLPSGANSFPSGTPVINDLHGVENAVAAILAAAGTAA
jgi:phosphoglycolate phosphatase-like HAD superfamily hydrolase